MLLELDYLQFQSNLRLGRTGEQQQVWDPIRRKMVALTPEELLRQLVLQYLLVVKQYPPNRIRTEIGIAVNGMPRRCDIVVFDAAVKPWLLVECKSPKVALTQAAMDQAARYNLALQVPFLAVTNGLYTSCCVLDHAEQRYEFATDYPNFPVMSDVQ